MGRCVTNDVHLLLDLKNKVNVSLITYGEEAYERFVRLCDKYNIDPCKFRIEVEMRAKGGSVGNTDTYFYGEGRRFRSVKEIVRFYDPHPPITVSDEYIEKQILKKKLDLDRIIRQTVELCEPSVVKLKAEPSIFPFFNEDRYTTGFYDSRGRYRSMCIHPYNKTTIRYGKIGWQHTSDCMCSIHRNKSYWRRLTSKALSIRTNSILNNEDFMETVVGMRSKAYLQYLSDGFIKNFSGILPEYELSQTPESLYTKYVIDEYYPRCAGKGLTSHLDIAHFLAKVFNYKNTQLLLKDGEQATLMGVPKHNKILINGKKGGTICYDAYENFKTIIPSKNAIDYFYKFVIEFGD